MSRIISFVISFFVCLALIFCGRWGASMVLSKATLNFFDPISVVVAIVASLVLLKRGR